MKKNQFHNEYPSMQVLQFSTLQRLTIGESKRKILKNKNKFIVIFAKSNNKEL